MSASVSSSPSTPCCGRRELVIGTIRTLNPYKQPGRARRPRIAKVQIPGDYRPPPAEVLLLVRADSERRTASRYCFCLVAPTTMLGRPSDGELADGDVVPRSASHAIAASRRDVIAAGRGLPEDGTALTHRLTGHRSRSPTGCGRPETLPAGCRVGRTASVGPVVSPLPLPPGCSRLRRRPRDACKGRSGGVRTAGRLEHAFPARLRSSGASLPRRPKIVRSEREFSASPDVR
jgi:hypothetical protein